MEFTTQGGPFQVFLISALLHTSPKRIKKKEFLRETGNGGSPPGCGQTGGQDGNPPSPHSQREVPSVQYPDYYYELSPRMRQHWRRRNRWKWRVWSGHSLDSTLRPVRRERERKTERERENKREIRVLVLLMYIGVYRTGGPDPNSFGYRPSPY